MFMLHGVGMFILTASAGASTVSALVKPAWSAMPNRFAVEFWKGTGWMQPGCLDTGVHFKPTATGCPLSHRSYHLDSIHNIWPVSRIAHFDQICNSESNATGLRDTRGCSSTTSSGMLGELLARDSCGVSFAVASCATSAAPADTGVALHHAPKIPSLPLRGCETSTAKRGPSA